MATKGKVYGRPKVEGFSVSACLVGTVQIIVADDDTPHNVGRPVCVGWDRDGSRCGGKAIYYLDRQGWDSGEGVTLRDLAPNESILIQPEDAK